MCGKLKILPKYLEKRGKCSNFANELQNNIAEWSSW